MFQFFNKTPTPQNKGFKVVINNDRLKKYGIASPNLKIMRKKIKEKFKKLDFDLFLNDGSQIEDEEFFSTIQAQSLIIVAEKGEEVKSELQIVIEMFRKVNSEILEAQHLFQKFIEVSGSSDILKALTFLSNEIEEKTIQTSRHDHVEWFEGISGNSKEEVMRRKAADRIKGYFYKTKDELTKSGIYRTNFKAREVIENLLTDFFLFLNGVDYFNCLFDRSYKVKFLPVADETDAKAVKIPKRRRVDSETKAKIAENDWFKSVLVGLSDDNGNFKCHGAWNCTKCFYGHKINPYASKQSAILFSIYNFDHQIEISRSIFPSILENIEKLATGKSSCTQHNKPGISVSVLTYFFEIFTMKNLKFVHIVCHDKSGHDLKSKGKILCVDCLEHKKLQKIKLKIS